MEGTHGKLGPGLSNGLGGNNSYRRAQFNHLACPQIPSITFPAQSSQCFAGNRRADANRLNFFVLANLLGARPVDNCSLLHVLPNSLRGNSASDFESKILPQIFCIPLGNHNTLCLFAIFLDNKHVVRNIDQPPCQISRSRGSQSSICSTLSCSVSGNKVFKYIKSFLKRMFYRKFDNAARGVNHQTFHPGHLHRLRPRTSRARINNRENRFSFGQRKTFGDQFLNRGFYTLPYLDYFS